jgi:hypothetical protein
MPLGIEPTLCSCWPQTGESMEERVPSLIAVSAERRKPHCPLHQEAVRRMLSLRGESKEEIPIKDADA